MKVVNQYGNTVTEIYSAAIVEHIDMYNKRSIFIEGRSTYNGRVFLGKYNNKHQAEYIIQELAKEPEVYFMPPEQFDEADDFIYEL